MHTKDVTEKALEDYNDVFADIVNGLLFEGNEYVKVTDLEGATARSNYKAGDKIHQQERDVAKYWKDGLIRIDMYGLENQTKVNADMPLRVISYDGAEYGKQVRDKERKERYPVITLVLYFGKGKWNGPKELLERVKVPNELKPYVNNYKINVFEIGDLDLEQVERFKSDFRIIAEYFQHEALKKEYRGSDLKLKHTEEVLDLLGALTNDERFEEMQKKMKRIQEGGQEIMGSWVLDQAEKRGEERGEARGEATGEVKAWAATLQNLKMKFSWSDEDAMRIMGIPAEKQSQVLEALYHNQK